MRPLRGSASTSIATSVARRAVRGSGSVHNSALPFWFPAAPLQKSPKRARRSRPRPRKSRSRSWRSPGRSVSSSPRHGVSGRAVLLRPRVMGHRRRVLRWVDACWVCVRAFSPPRWHRSTSPFLGRLVTWRSSPSPARHRPLGSVVSDRPRTWGGRPPIVRPRRRVIRHRPGVRVERRASIPVAGAYGTTGARSRRSPAQIGSRTARRSPPLSHPVPCRPVPADDLASFPIVVSSFRSVDASFQRDLPDFRTPNEASGSVAGGPLVHLDAP